MMKPDINIDLLERGGFNGEKVEAELTDDHNIENEKLKNLNNKNNNLDQENKYCLRDDTSNKTIKSKCFMNIRSFAACLSMLQLVQVMGSGPRTIAAGSLLMAIASLVSAIPQFVGGSYDVFRYYGNGEKQAMGFVKAHLSIQSHVTNFSRFRNDTTMDTDDSSFKIQNVNYIFKEQMMNFSKTLSPHVSSNAFDKSASSSLKVLLDSRHLTSFVEQPVTSRKTFLNERQAEYKSKTNHLKSDQSLLSEKISSVQLCKLRKFPGIAVKMAASRGDKTEGAKDDSSLFLFIAAGSVLKGMGHAPLHPLGMSFIDDFAAPRNSALYIGMVSSLSLLGPAFGFLLGSVTTNLWVDSGWTNTSSLPISPHDPDWVGAWWVGYILVGILLLIVPMPLYCFPRKIAKEDETESSSDKSCFLWVKKYCGEKIDDDAISAHEDKSDDKNLTKAPEVALLHPQVDYDHKIKLDKRFDEWITNEKCLKDLKNANLCPAIKQFCHRKPSSFSESSISKRLSLYAPRKYSAAVLLGNGTKVLSKSTSLLKRSASAPRLTWQFSRKFSKQSCKPYSTASEYVASRTTSTRRLHMSTTNLSLKDFFVALKLLLRDPVFMFITLGFVSLTSFLASSITYASKYMESMFDLTASMANLMNGSVNLPMAVVGNIAGGIIIRRQNFNVKQTILLILLGLFITISAVSTLLFVGWNNNNIRGFNFDRESLCSRGCGCSDVYSPVCDVTTNITYRSACHAGCDAIRLEGEKMVYYNCKCLSRFDDSLRMSENVSDVTTFNIGSSVYNGACSKDVDWRKLIIFVVVMGTASMATGLASTPSTLAILRVVPPSDKALAIGVVFVFTRILAWIPSPVYVGAIIDASCLLWTVQVDNGNSPQQPKHCEVYDKSWLRFGFFGSIGIQLLVATLFYVTSYCLVSKRHKARGKLHHGDVTPDLRNLNRQRHNKNDFVDDV